VKIGKQKAESPSRTGQGVCPHCGGTLPSEADGKARHRYALRRRRGLWRVVLEGEESLFTDEKGGRVCGTVVD
jgi:hypothetical protein